MLAYLPIEPTKEMLEAAAKGYADGYKEHRKKVAEEIYRLMVKEYMKQTREGKE